MGFDLGAMLAQSGVQIGHNAREQIEYIGLDKLISDEKNYFSLSDLSELADNIATIGLQQPIRVRPDGERYRIVSGHRRTAALRELHKEDPEKWSEAPCIVETDTASPALQELRLIFANSNIRRMTSSEISETAARTETLLYQLQEEGMEFPGRMRDHVAKAVGVSKTKLARLAVIRKGLKCGWPGLYKQNIISEDTAYSLARLPEYLQADIEKFAGNDARRVSARLAEDVAAMDKQISACNHKCGCDACPNRARIINRLVASAVGWGYAPRCPGCCMDCQNRLTCGYTCRQVEAEKRQYRAEQRAEKQAAAERKAERERPTIEYLQSCYDRAVTACAAAGVDTDAFSREVSTYSPIETMKNMNAAKEGRVQFTVTSSLPYGWSFTAETAQRLCAAADLLGVTTDYLLGRDEPQKKNPTWSSGYPKAPGRYAAVHQMDDTCYTEVDIMDYDQDGWRLFGQLTEPLGMVVTAWAPLPSSNAPDDALEPDLQQLLDELDTPEE